MARRQWEKWEILMHPKGGEEKQGLSVAMGDSAQSLRMEASSQQPRATWAPGSQCDVRMGCSVGKHTDLLGTKASRSHMRAAAEDGAPVCLQAQEQAREA